MLSAMVLRALDLLVDYISGGTYGTDFTAEQTQNRNAFRENLDRDWQTYLATTELALSPGVTVLIASSMYVGVAFSTEAGKVRAQTWTQKIKGIFISRFFKK